MPQVTDLLVCDNFDFDRNTRPYAATITQAGQLIIGTGATPAMQGGFITSTGGTISVTNSAGNIDIEAAGTVGQTITGNDGNPLAPVIGNWNIVGNNTAQNALAAYNTGTGNTLTVNSYGVVNYTVNSTAGVGTHTTLASALTAVSGAGGGTVWLTQTVTENVTIPANCVIRSAGSGQGGITGKVAMTAAGTSRLVGLTLTTNGDNCVEITGANATALYVDNCFINATDATALDMSGSGGGSAIVVKDCGGAVANGIALFTVTNTQPMYFFNSNFADGQNTSTQASTVSGSGGVIATDTVFPNPITTSSSGNVQLYNCRIPLGSENTTAITHGGNVTSNSINCVYESGTATAVSVGAGSILNSFGDTVSSSNASAVGGAGTINHVGMKFSGSSFTIGTTTITGQPESGGPETRYWTDSTLSTLISTKADATSGPDIELWRNSPSPANGDAISRIKFLGESSTSVQREYGAIQGLIDTTTNGVEDSSLYFFTLQGGSAVQQMILLPTGGVYRGRNDNTAPGAGYIGEVIESITLQGAAVALTTNVSANVASVSLTAGKWLVFFDAGFTSPTTTPTLTQLAASISSTSATLSGSIGNTQFSLPVGGAPVTGVADSSMHVAAVQLNLASTTTYYAVVRAIFSAGDISGYGRITAVRRA